MKALLEKTASTLSGVILFCVGCAMAGLGLTVFVLLAVSALAMAGLAVLAAPFLPALAAQDVTDDHAAA